ncbi:MAG TPA: hypothetical protein VMV13_01630 [Candidatus Binataceae bacterium]|nr:hypothetical protein [Candidatus Binataceae bacterium]
MLAALLFWLSPARRRFMRRYARPALGAMRERLIHFGGPQAVGFVSIIQDANAEFLAYALARGGPLESYRDRATPATVEACLGAMLIFSVNMFAREEIAKNESELVRLLAAVIGCDPMQVMLRRDSLRKAPRSEEWALYAQLISALGGERPAYAAEVERAFGFNYLSYIGQYRGRLEREAARFDSDT